MGLVLNASKKRRLDEDGNPIELVQEESPSEVRVERKKLEFEFPPSMIEKMRETYSAVVVRDFGDDYHLTQEEKEKKFDLYDLYKPIASHKSKYNKIVQYINAMRECHRFIVAMAHKNRLIMPQEEFICGVYDGSIKVDFFSFPKYSGKDRKDINIKKIREYILDETKDPKELSMVKDIRYLPQEHLKDPEKYLNLYFSDDQIQSIFHSENTISNSMVYDPSIDGDGDRMGIVRQMSKKQFKKFKKGNPELTRAMVSVSNDRFVTDSLNSFTSELNIEVYDHVSKLDEKRGFLASDRKPQFTGELTKDNVTRYLYELDNFREDHEMINYRGTMMSISDYKDEMLRRELDDAGWNVRTLYDNEKELKKKKRASKRDKKKEKALRKKLQEIKERRDNRENSDYKKNGVNKKLNKGKKKNKKKNKAVANMLTAASGTGASDFQEYQDMMMDMTYGFEG